MKYNNNFISLSEYATYLVLPSLLPNSAAVLLWVCFPHSRELKVLLPTSKGYFRTGLKYRSLFIGVLQVLSGLRTPLPSSSDTMGRRVAVPAGRKKT